MGTTVYIVWQIEGNQRDVAAIRLCQREAESLAYRKWIEEYTNPHIRFEVESWIAN